MKIVNNVKTYDLSNVDDVREICNNAICKAYELKYEIERVLTKFEVNHDITLCTETLEKLFAEKRKADADVNKYSFMYDCMTLSN
jgi:hypothetical protein